MSNVIPFSFDQHPVRVIELDGQPWFVLNDVTEALEFSRGRDAARMLDEDEKGAHIVRVRSENGVEQDREFTITNESGLYSLILRSRKASAKRFKKWVTAEVLPQIRQTGRYAPATEQAAPAQPAEGWYGFQFAGEPFRVLQEHARLWFVAKDVHQALGAPGELSNLVRELNRVPGHTRQMPLPTGRKGADWLIDEPSLWNWMRVASVEREQQLMDWLNQVLRPALFTREGQAAPAPATPEDALRALLGRARFMCSLGDDGQLVLRQLKDGEMVLSAEQLPGWVRDPAGAPLACLPSLLQAASERLVGHALPHGRG